MLKKYMSKMWIFIFWTHSYKDPSSYLIMFKMCLQGIQYSICISGQDDSPGEKLKDRHQWSGAISEKG